LALKANVSSRKSVYFQNKLALLTNTTMVCFHLDQKIAKITLRFKATMQCLRFFHYREFKALTIGANFTEWKKMDQRSSSPAENKPDQVMLKPTILLISGLSIF
jgi:hypothetical protein